MEMHACQYMEYLLHIFFPDPFWCKFEMSYEYVFSLAENIAKASYAVFRGYSEVNYVMKIQGIVIDN